MYKKILVAVDFSDVSPSVIEHAKNFALSLGAKVRILHVEPNPDLLAVAVPDKEEREKLSEQPGGEEYQLKSLEKILVDAGIDADHKHRGGEPTTLIMQEAVAYEADLILIGSHGHGKIYHFLSGGGHREAIIEQAKVPVVVVKQAS
jgi:nucleotide-binding universal stress UspA family protein